MEFQDEPPSTVLIGGLDWTARWGARGPARKRIVRAQAGFQTSGRARSSSSIGKTSPSRVAISGFGTSSRVGRIRA